MFANQDSNKPHCLIGCSGSVATLKIPELVAELSPYFDVMVVGTRSAGFFLERAKNYNEIAWDNFESGGGMTKYLSDADEWEMWNKIGNAVLHIELRKWADIFIVAPGSADLISKASVGISDNLLLSIMRAWDFSKPCIICPAMNTLMWDHPSTPISLDTLRSWGWEILDPIEKLLACNDKGNGAMASVLQIKEYLLSKVVDNQVKLVNRRNTELLKEKIKGSAVDSTRATSPQRIILYVSIGAMIGAGGMLLFSKEKNFLNSSVDAMLKKLFR